MNTSDKAIYVSYQLDKNPSSSPIFYDRPIVYQLKKSNAIDWVKDMNVKVEGDKTINEINISIPPHCALVFGGLHNDKYTSYSQHFINDRVFNLQRLDITAYGKTLTLVPNTFDQHFKKHGGHIRYVVK